MERENAVISCIENFPGAASLKAADTGKYIVNNLVNSQLFGVNNPKDLVGLTIKDLNYCLPEWGKQYAETIEALDFRARERKTHVTSKHYFLDHSGTAQLEEMIKFPILGLRNNILGIVTYRHDITSTLSPSGLYRLYRNFYDIPTAIKRVLHLIKIEKHFFVLPTDAQFRVFLHKVERFSNKEIARLLGTSDRTVESHLNALRIKVAGGNLPRAISLVKWSANEI